MCCHKISTYIKKSKGIKSCLVQKPYVHFCMSFVHTFNHFVHYVESVKLKLPTLEAYFDKTWILEFIIIAIGSQLCKWVTCQTGGKRFWKQALRMKIMLETTIPEVSLMIKWLWLNFSVLWRNKIHFKLINEKLN